MITPLSSADSRNPECCAWPLLLLRHISALDSAPAVQGLVTQGRSLGIPIEPALPDNIDADFDFILVPSSPCPRPPSPVPSPSPKDNNLWAVPASRLASPPRPRPPHRQSQEGPSPLPC